MNELLEVLRRQAHHFGPELAHTAYKRGLAVTQKDGTTRPIPITATPVILDAAEIRRRARALRPAVLGHAEDDARRARRRATPSVLLGALCPLERRLAEPTWPALHPARHHARGLLRGPAAARGRWRSTPPSPRCRATRTSRRAPSSRWWAATSATRSAPSPSLHRAQRQQRAGALPRAAGRLRGRARRQARRRRSPCCAAATTRRSPSSATWPSASASSAPTRTWCTRTSSPATTPFAARGKTLRARLPPPLRAPAGGDAQRRTWRTSSARCRARRRVFLNPPASQVEVKTTFALLSQALARAARSPRPRASRRGAGGHRAARCPGRAPSAPAPRTGPDGERVDGPGRRTWPRTPRASCSSAPGTTAARPCSSGRSVGIALLRGARAGRLRRARCPGRELCERAATDPAGGGFVVQEIVDTHARGPPALRRDGRTPTLDLYVDYSAYASVGLERQPAWGGVCRGSMLARSSTSWAAAACCR